MIRVRKQSLTIVLLIVAFLTACTSSKEIKYGGQIIGLGSPIALGYDSTLVLLQDYFMSPEELDSVASNSGLEVNWSADKLEVMLVGNMQPKLGVLSFWDGDVKYDLLLKKTNLEEVVFRIRDKNYKQVQVKGEMNSWNPNQTPLTKKNGVWEASMLLNQGIYQYLFVIDGKETLDPENSITVSNGMGGFNNLLEVGSLDNTKQPVLETKSIQGNEISFNTINTDRVIVYWENHQLKTTRDGNEVSIKIPEAASSLDYSQLRAWGYNSNGISNDVLIPLKGKNVVEDTRKLARTDAHSWNMYFILIDRFKDGNPANTRKVDDPEILPQANYYGGDLAGITEAIKNGYFKKIGVNSLWLSPISQNPEEAYGLWDKGGVKTKFSGYHGYWPISSSKIDDRFGTEDEFKELLDVAHKNGMSVILDYVANHVHELHPVYQNHKDWATDLYLPDGRMNTELWDEHRLTTWFDVFMPSLDFSKPEVIETMTDSALFWVNNYDLDGFRHDATKHIQLDFWRTLTRKVKEQVITKQHKKVFQIGETYGSRELVASYINSGMLDSQFDFNMYDASLNTFGQNFSFKGLESQLQESFNYFGYHNTMGIISGNHDKPRFVSLTSGEVLWDEDTKLAGWTREIGAPQAFAYDRLNMLLAFNLTIPGIPITYSGDEFGSPGANDPDNRRWMKFEESELSKLELHNRNVFAMLSEIRNSNMALLYGDFQFMVAEDDVLAYSRTYFKQQVITVFNKSDSTKEISISLRKGFDYSKLVGYFGNRFKVTDGVLKVTLPANQFEILTL